MDLLVIIELRNGHIHPMSWEALAGGQFLAKEMGLSVSALIMGYEIGDIAQEVTRKKIKEVRVCESPLLKEYQSDLYAQALAQVIKSESPPYVLMGHTYMVRDFLPKVSAILRKPFFGDTVAVRIENSRPVFTKQVFQGKLLAEVIPSGEGPYLVSFQSAAFQQDAVEAGTGAPIRKISVMLDESQVRTTSEAPFQEVKSQVDLASAQVIVSVGRGIGKQENLVMVRELAEAIGAQLAASRPVVDAGWLPAYHQVGSSGQTVAPKLYLALGISGAIQHVVGMKGSKNIVVINKDPDAPIFELADYGVVGDILEIIPKLTQAVKTL